MVWKETMSDLGMRPDFGRVPLLCLLHHIGEIPYYVLLWQNVITIIRMNTLGDQNNHLTVSKIP